MQRELSMCSCHITILQNKIIMYNIVNESLKSVAKFKCLGITINQMLHSQRN